MCAYLLTRIGTTVHERSFDAIAREPFALPSERPLVMFENPHESLEKSLHCYLNGMTPLIAEKNLEVTLAAAAKYEIDALVCDSASLAKLHPFLSTRRIPLSSISVIDSASDLEALKPFGRFAETLRLVRVDRETGAVIESTCL